MKRCIICKTPFVPVYSQLQKTCSNVGCVISYSKNQEQKKYNQWKKEVKERHKGIKYYLNKVKLVFNRYIRLRDKNKGCISCSRRLDGKYDAGHYLTYAGHPAHRFSEINVNAQCTQCNQHLSGNLVNYRIGLIRRYGEPLVNQLEEKRNEEKRYTIEELKTMIELYNTKIKNL